MTRVWSTLLVLTVVCLVGVNIASAAEKKERKKGDRPSPEARFDAMEKAVKHDPLKGELTKDEFCEAMKALSPRMADRAGEFFKRIKKADENKVTKEEYVAAMKEFAKKRGEKKNK